MERTRDSDDGDIVEEGEDGEDGAARDITRRDRVADASHISEGQLGSYRGK